MQQDEPDIRGTGTFEPLVHSSTQIFAKKRDCLQSIVLVKCSPNKIWFELSEIYYNMTRSHFSEVPEKRTTLKLCIT